MIYPKSFQQAFKGGITMKKELKFIIIGIFILAITGCIVRNQSSAHYSIKEGSAFTDTLREVQNNFP